MAVTVATESQPQAKALAPVFTQRRLHGAATLRIIFGMIWSIDASFKFLPGFVHGQTLGKELGAAADIHTPVIHQWILLWHNVGTANPAAFAIGTGVIESLIALSLLAGAFTNVAFIGSAVFSFGIWSAAEGFHLPWTKAGITDLGPSVAYIFASLLLFVACAGATWSVDGWLRPRLARFGLGWMSSKSPAELAG